MTHDEGQPPVSPLETVARRVQELRQRHGWTAAGLGRMCADLGKPELNRSVIANLESGRRRYVTVDELFLLAAALQVAPIHLLVPIDDDNAHYAPVPGADLPADWVREWVRGRRPLPGSDRRVYFSEVPASEWEKTEPSDDELAERERTFRLLRQALGGKRGGGDGAH